MEGCKFRAWTMVNCISMKAHGWLLTTLKSGSLFSRETPLNYFYAVTKCLLQEREEQEGNLELNQHAQHPNWHDLYFTAMTELGQAYAMHRQGCSQGLALLEGLRSSKATNWDVFFFVIFPCVLLARHINAHSAQGKSKTAQAKVKWQEEGEPRRLKSQSFSFQRKCRWSLVPVELD